MKADVVNEIKLKQSQWCAKCGAVVVDCIQVLIGLPDHPRLKHYCVGCYEEVLWDTKRE